MAALVAPGICRYTINQTYGGRPVVNIIDMQIDTTGTGWDRGEAIRLAAGDILNNWVEHVMTIQTSAVTFSSVSWVDLNSEDGPTGIRTSTSNETLPKNGTASGTNGWGNVAWRVNKGGSAVRGQRSGRMYLVGVPEEANENSNPSVVIPTWAGYVNTAMGDFLDGINDVEGMSDITRKMVVLHVVAGLYQGYGDVESLTCDARFGSQRRRLRG